MSAVDIVYIKALEVDAVIGVYDWERDIRQTLVIDLDLASDNQLAATQDRIEDAIDYAAICRVVIDLVSGSSYQLLESLAEAVAQQIMADFPVPWLRLQIGKPGAVAEAADVGVIIERGERP